MNKLLEQLFMGWEEKGHNQEKGMESTKAIFFVYCLVVSDGVI